MPLSQGLPSGEPRLRHNSNVTSSERPSVTSQISQVRVTCSHYYTPLNFFFTESCYELNYIPPKFVC